MKRKCYVCATEMKKASAKGYKGYKACLCPICGEKVFSSEEV